MLSSERNDALSVLQRKIATDSLDQSQVAFVDFVHANGSGKTKQLVEVFTVVSNVEIYPAVCGSERDRRIRACWLVTDGCKLVDQFNVAGVVSEAISRD